MLSEDFPVHLAGFRAGSLVAGYRLEARVGAGGMAVVFRARDERLGRPVALKILAPALAADGAFRRRFIAESRAAAAVDDPHIIPVYEAGEAGGVLFIAMRFVRGGDLRLVLEREGALAPARAAAFISPVASALDAAHGAGLVHRDVKPANILVDARPDRPDHVYLSDFGVSKGAVSSVSLTGAGQFLGTPDYSAPEQVSGRAVDGRADQYALACVAYQLLTGVVPFERDQGMAVLLAHLSEPPPSLGSRRPDLPGAADQVLARGLAKAPENRYGSCRDFADALREALGLAPYISLGSASAAGHPRTEIASPQPHVPGPDLAGTGKAAVPAGPAAPATADWAPGGGPASAADVPAAAVIAIGPAHPGIHAETVPPAATAVAQDGIPATAATAMAASQSAGTGTAAGSGALPGEPDKPTAEADGPAGTTGVLTGGQRAWSDPGSGGGVQSARRPPRPIVSRPGTRTAWIRRHRLLVIALAGAVLAAAGVVPFVLATSPNPPSSPSGSPSSPSSPSSPNDSRVVTLTDPTTSSEVTSVAFSPSGTTLAAADQYGNAYLWNIATRSLTAALTVPSSQGVQGVTSVAFSPSGTTLAAGDLTDSTYLWNIVTQSPTATLTGPNSNPVYSVAFSPNGTTLAAGDENGSTYLWNIATKKLTATLTGPSSQSVTSVAFSPNGTTLATGDSNGSTYLWNAATQSLTATLTGPSSQSVTSVAFSPNGTTLATGDSNGSTYLWNAATQSLTATLTGPSRQAVNSVAFSPNGTTLATGDENGSTYLWNIATKKLTATLTGPNSNSVYSVAFSPNGTTLATVDGHDSIYLWHMG